MIDAYHCIPFRMHVKSNVKSMKINQTIHIMNRKRKNQILITHVKSVI